jgi:predicted DNA-binding protein (MmcQ/YjbR family)
MTRARLRKLCLSLPEATSDFPFDEATEAFRVRGKIFALHFGGQRTPIEVNLKCDPDLAADLRSTYPDIAPGWHMSHRHWNTVRLDGELADSKIEWLIGHSYDCVVAGLPRAVRDALGRKRARLAEGEKPRARGAISPARR